MSRVYNFSAGPAVLPEEVLKEAAAEMLLDAKGYTDAVVSITEDSVDVVINMSEVDEAGRAQIEDIVKRKTEVSAENIVISLLNLGD